MTGHWLPLSLDEVSQIAEELHRPMGVQQLTEAATVLDGCDLVNGPPTLADLAAHILVGLGVARVLGDKTPQLLWLMLDCLADKNGHELIAPDEAEFEWAASLLYGAMEGVVTAQELARQLASRLVPFDERSSHRMQEGQEERQAQQSSESLAPPRPLNLATRLQGPRDVPESLAIAAMSDDASLTIAVRQVEGSMPSLGALLRSLAADRAFASARGDEDAERKASRDLGVAGAVYDQRRRRTLAEALWRRELNYDPYSPVARTRLGQLLAHKGEYSEAVELLETAEDFDNYARLARGWCRIRMASDADDAELAEKLRSDGVEDVLKALRVWAYMAAEEERGKWLRQARRLTIETDVDRKTLEQLTAWARRVSAWIDMQVDDLYETSEP